MYHDFATVNIFRYFKFGPSSNLLEWWLILVIFQICVSKYARAIFRWDSSDMDMVALVVTFHAFLRFAAMLVRSQSKPVNMQLMQESNWFNLKKEMTTVNFSGVSVE
ncbi:hypothetical protein Ddye_021513 [Dipteronia dyeriana]|uniref:Uncharacterized protein n=1 Tax=Dipteronia dyeriana TaxID=168575 RepID=A0AAD9U289_9ROSI|nr:hypothetical protein Ddye_021513 [Dipteronia dyeriana]